MAPSSRPLPLPRPGKNAPGKPPGCSPPCTCAASVSWVVPGDVPGEARTAKTPDDLGLVAEWLAAFHDEVQPDAQVRDWAVVAK